MTMLRDAAGEAALDSFVLPPESTLAEAIARQRLNRQGLLAVVHAEGVVVATVTDDAIRRAVLEGQSLEGPVAEVMNRRPAVVLAGASEEEILDLMRAHRIRCVPVVDRTGRLVEVRSSGGFPDSTPQPIGVIMAGGRGERLRPLTDKVPKPLLRVGPSSIVERLIAGLNVASVNEIFLAVNYKAEEFERRLGDGAALGVKLGYLRESKPLGTAGALSLLPAAPRGPVVVTNGDIVTTLDFARLLDFHWHHRGAVTVAGVPYFSPIPYGVLQTAQHHLLSIEEKPHRRDLCNAGVYVLEPEVLRLIPTDTPTGMPELLAAVLAEGLPVHVFPILEKWFDIGGSAEFERVLVDFALGEAD